MTASSLLTLIIIAALVISVGTGIFGLVLFARMGDLQKELGELRQEHQRLRR